MKILYGIQGTGNGHIARARVLAKCLAKYANIDVDYIFSGRDPKKYFDMQVFPNYQTRCGLTFVHEHGAINKRKTLTQARPLKLIRDIKGLDMRQYDLVLNDFEPVTAWAAKLAKVPSISISHQAAFSHPVPKKGEGLSDRLIMRYFAPTDIKLGVHWYHFGHNIMPPFIDEPQAEGETDHHFVVYLPFENLEDIKGLLDPFSEFTFEVFHPDVAADRDDEHLKWRKPCKSGFSTSLQRCAGVIANGGFELSSECLHLGKKLLIKPLQGQFEQLSNAFTLKQLDLCRVMDNLDTEAVEQWTQAPSTESVHFPSDPDIFVQWLLQRQWQESDKLCQQLWQQVRYPERVRSKLAMMHGFA